MFPYYEAPCDTSSLAPPVPTCHLPGHVMAYCKPPGFIEPCIPTRADKPPVGPDWIHEIKHDGYRMIVRKKDGRVRLFTRRGYDWTDRFPLIREAPRSGSQRARVPLRLRSPGVGRNRPADRAPGGAGAGFSTSCGRSLTRASSSTSTSPGTERPYSSTPAGSDLRASSRSTDNIRTDPDRRSHGSRLRTHRPPRGCGFKKRNRKTLGRPCRLITGGRRRLNVAMLHICKRLIGAAFRNEGVSRTSSGGTQPLA